MLRIDNFYVTISYYKGKEKLNFSKKTIKNMISQEKFLEMIKNDNIITQTSKFHGKVIKNFNWLVDEENIQHFVIEFDMVDNDRFLTILIKDNNTFDFTLDYTIENNKINKNLLKKLQNLSYINIRENNDLDNINILYVICCWR